MNTTMFSRYVADKYGTTYKDTHQWVMAIIESMGDVLISGDDLQFTNFATFKTYISPEQMGRNKHTGEPILIPERRRVKFVLSTHIRDLMWEQYELDSGVKQNTTPVKMADIGIKEDDDVTEDETE